MFFLTFFDKNIDFYRISVKIAAVNSDYLFTLEVFTMALACYNSTFEIDLSVLQKNVRSIINSLPAGTEMIPVLKGDAYGFGAVETARAITECADIKTIALAQIGEAIVLREAGFRQELLVLGAFPPSQLSLAVEHNLQLTVFREDMAFALEAEAASQGKTIGIQIKIETGLNRIGVKPGKTLSELADVLKKLPHIAVKGAFTHFIDGEIPGSESAKKQFALYNEALTQLSDSGISVPMRHICNSGASDWFCEAYLDAVRIGRRLYMDNRDLPLPSGVVGAVDEVGSWRTTIVNVHTVSPGETVGYDGIFTANRPTYVATICVGYGDGLCMDFVKAGSPVLVNGKLARYIGICMDQSFLDVTNIPCTIGDEVTIFGHAGDGSFLSAQYLAKTVGHEGVYFTDLISPRVKRRYLNG